MATVAGMPGEAITLGAVTRTGRAIIIAIRADPAAPSFAGRWKITLVPGGLPDQPYHAATAAPVTRRGWSARWSRPLSGRPWPR